MAPLGPGRKSAVSRVGLELRPLPSPGITRLQRYYGPLRHPTRPGLTLAGCRLTLTITAGASRVASGPLNKHAVATTPAGPMELVRSYCPTVTGLPRIQGGSAPASAVSRPAQRLLTLRPAHSLSRHATLLHRRLQQLHYFRRCFGCYRAERTSSRAGLAPAVDQRLFTAHSNQWLTRVTVRSPPNG